MINIDLPIGYIETDSGVEGMLRIRTVRVRDIDIEGQKYILDPMDLHFCKIDYENGEEQSPRRVWIRADNEDQTAVSGLHELGKFLLTIAKNDATIGTIGDNFDGFKKGTLAFSELELNNLEYTRKLGQLSTHGDCQRIDIADRKAKMRLMKQARSNARTAVTKKVARRHHSNVN